MSLGLNPLGLEPVGLDAAATAGGGGPKLVSAANGQQSNVASAGSVSQSSSTFVAGSSSNQSNVASTAAIFQAAPSLVTAANSSQANTASAGSVTQPVGGLITLPPVKDWETGSLKLGATYQADVRNIATGVLVVRKTGLVTNATTGAGSFSDAAIVAGTTYEVATRFADGSKGMWDYTAT